MKFQDAASTVVTFGIHQGKKLDTIAETDEGLLYLDYLYGVTHSGDLKEALSAYLSDPVVDKDLQALISDRRERRH